MESISIKLPSNLRRRLVEEAKRRNVPQSAIVREAIERTLKDSSASEQPATCLDLVRDLAGAFRSGRDDLATNKALLEQSMLGTARRVAKRRR